MNLENLGLWGLFWGTFLSATIFPFSSDALFIGAFAAIGKPVACVIVASAGNWLGGIVTYYMGRLGKLEWIEKYFKVSPEKLQKQREYVDRYGVWLALVSWVPFIGDVLALALGFYRSNAFWTILLLLIGKAGRFICWAMIIQSTIK